ncbi:MAG TPA: YlxM family DNA-binding protein [Symbiobacteriaceae bacterium]|nr:YlxM family DNA-binding protein [Symbiobacteriaceae bacterium]
MLKDLENMALLFDFYGALLTERQQELMQAYYLEDLSLAEIAGEGGVSRQAVHDLIKRAEASLQEYEERLGFVREYRQRQERLARLEEALTREDLAAARALLEAVKAE